MRRLLSRIPFSKKEELIFIGDETLVQAAHDVLIKTKPDAPTSQLDLPLSRLYVKVNHFPMQASFQPGFVVKKDAESGGSVNSLWVVLCNIDDKNLEGNILGDLVQELSVYGKSVLWLTGMWKLDPNDATRLSSSQFSISSHEIGGSHADTEYGPRNETITAPPSGESPSFFAGANIKDNGDNITKTYYNAYQSIPKAPMVPGTASQPDRRHALSDGVKVPVVCSEDDKDKIKKKSFRLSLLTQSSFRVTPKSSFTQPSSPTYDNGSLETHSGPHDKPAASPVTVLGVENMNDGERTCTNPPASATHVHDTVSPRTQICAHDEITTGGSAHSSDIKINPTQSSHPASSTPDVFDNNTNSRRSVTGLPEIGNLDNPHSTPVASLDYTMRSTFSLDNENQNDGSNGHTHNNNPVSQSSEKAASPSHRQAIENINPPLQTSWGNGKTSSTVEKASTVDFNTVQNMATTSEQKAQVTNPVSSQIAHKQRELKLRNQVLKPSLKKGARYFRWSDEPSLLAALEALVKRKEGDLTMKRRESIHLPSLAGHGPATEVEDSLELSEDDFIIAVMGPTGAGKSTFIQHATGYDELKIGDDLESCTSEIHVIRIGNSNIYIVDTPGFNDTNRTDLDIFKLISEWLEKRFTNQVYLSGLVYLHRISDNRMGGTTLKNFQIFEKLCGKDCFHKVTLATTMWDDVDEDIGKDRERQLRDDYFSHLVRNKARFERLQNSPASAKKLIEEIINDATDLRPLSLQKELVAYNKDLQHTEAGRKMYAKLDDVLQSHQAALQQLNRDLRTEKSEQVQTLLKKEHEELTRDLIALIADMQYMQLDLPTRLRNYVKRVVAKE